VTGHEYLLSVLRAQTPSDTELAPLRNARDHVERILRPFYGPYARFYYGGSFAKRTMVRAGYDLDIIVYVPHDDRRPLSDLFWGGLRTLEHNGMFVTPKTVALRLPYDSGFHIDVVPGHAHGADFRYATLFKNLQPASSLQTSVKVHIESVKDAGLSDVVRVAKLWKQRHRIDLATFALEIAVQRALAGHRRDDLAAAFRTVLNWFTTDFSTARLVDPANSNNIIDVPSVVRAHVVGTANQSLVATNWNQIVG
jgi:hypothetical protein